MTPAFLAPVLAILAAAGGVLGWEVSRPGLVARRGVRARLRRQAVRGYEPRRVAA